MREQGSVGHAQAAFSEAAANVTASHKRPSSSARRSPLSLVSERACGPAGRGEYQASSSDADDECPGGERAVDTMPKWGSFPGSGGAIASIPGDLATENLAEPRDKRLQPAPLLRSALRAEAQWREAKKAASRRVRFLDPKTLQVEDATCPREYLRGYAAELGLLERCVEDFSVGDGGGNVFATAADASPPQRQHRSPLAISIRPETPSSSSCGEEEEEGRSCHTATEGPLSRA